jgi:hypothetical protein
MMVYRPNTEVSGDRWRAKFDANRIWPLARFATAGVRGGWRVGAPMSDDFWAIPNERRTKTVD